MIGRTIGRYRVVEKLGEGGMGSVWRAEDPVLGRNVAIKLLPEHAADSPEAKERLLREARAACSLHHAGIATVYEAGEDAGRVYIAFEHVDGETVAQHVKREGPLPVEEALRIARRAAEALGHAHDNGILHRDVTAGNLMLDRQGAVKLVDFGLTLPEEPSRRTRDTSATTPGTIGYIAPEIVTGARGDRRADLYGLGVVLYEMLTGHLPFERDRAEAVLYAVVHEEPMPPRKHRPELSVDIEAIALRAIAKESAERFTDAGELGRALEEGGLVGNGTTGKRHRPSFRASALAGLFLVVTALAVWKFVGPGPAPRFDSVAVLPLSLPGDNAEEIAYLATGLGDALSGRLSRVVGLRVTPWVTSRRYSPDELPLPDIAAELNVESLVVGSFREDEGQMRITIALRDGATGETMWSAQFEDTRLGLLGLQGVISLAVATSIRGALTPEEEESLVGTPTDRADAFDEYLRGVADLENPTRAGKDGALARFENAIAIDPQLAEAWIGVGAVHITRYNQSWHGERSLTLAKQSFDRALRIDPTSVPALQGMIRVSFFFDPDECLRLARRVRDLGEVNVGTLLSQAEGMAFGGLAEEAVPLLRTVEQLDPANQGCRWWLILVLRWAGDVAGSIETADAFLRDFGEDPDVHLWLASAFYCLGDRESARRHWARCIDLMGDDTQAFAWVEAAIGTGDPDGKEMARHAIGLLESRRPGISVNPRLESSLVRLYAAVGDTAKVIEGATRLLDSGDAWRANPDILQLALAFVEVGRADLADDLIREMTERLRPREGDVAPEWKPFLASEHLRGCVPPMGDVSALQELPAYDGLMRAYRAELERRRSLYGR